MSTARRTTPGSDGYVIAVAISILVTAVGLMVMQYPFPAGRGGTWGVVGGLALALLFALVYVTLVAALVAPVGVLVLHVVCRRIAAQWVHVVVAASIGLVAAALAQPLLSGVDGLEHVRWLLVVLPLATGLGRAAVIGRRRPA